MNETIDLVGRKCKCGEPMNGSHIYTSQTEGAVDYHCPCGIVTTIRKKKVFDCPEVAADAVVLRENDHGYTQVLLIERKNEPYGWALPGGIVERGESCESAMFRELKEETNLDAINAFQLGVWSQPDRDPRGHVISVAYLVHEEAIVNMDELQAKDDAVNFDWFTIDEPFLPELAFPDHMEMIHRATAKRKKL